MDARLLQNRGTVLNPPYCQSTGIGGYLKELLYLTVANTILWCIVIALASNTLRATVKAKHIHSARARRLLVIYISVMTIVSTISLGLMIQYTHKTLFSPFDGGIDARRHLETLISSTLFVTLPFAVFGADGLMVRFPATWHVQMSFQLINYLNRYGAAGCYTMASNGY
jgi:hypothetical protein